MKKKISYFLSVILFLTHPSYSSSSDEISAPRTRILTIDNEETDLFTGFLYKIKLKNSTKVLDSKDNTLKKLYAIKKVDSLTPDQEGYNHQVWSFIKSLRPDYNQHHYILRSIGNRDQVLDSGDEVFFHHLTSWGLHNPNHQHYSRQLWILKKLNGGYSLQSESMNKNSTHIKKDEDNRVIKSKSSAQLVWEFIPVNYKLSTTIEDFVYGDFIIDQLTKQVKVFHTTLSNQKDNDNADTSTIMIDEITKNSFSWSFSVSKERSFLNQLEVHCLVTAKFPSTPSPPSTPSIAPGPEIGVQGGIKNTTTWGNKDTSLEETRKENVSETKFSQSYTVAIPPQKKIDVSMRWVKHEGNIPFSATARIKAVTDYLKGNNVMKKGVEVKAHELEAFLRSSGYEGDNITAIYLKDKTALITLKGECHIDNALYGNVLTEWSSN